MRVVLGDFALGAPGGIETYTVTVADHLQRLGHDVAVFTLSEGVMADDARKRGLAVVSRASLLPERCDVVYAQDARTAALLGARYARVPLAFCAHGETVGLHVPSQLPEAVQMVVVLNDLMGRHADALAMRPPITRLRQPVDIERFSPRGSARPRARRLLAIGNYLGGPRLEMVEEACRQTGLECVRIGGPAGNSTLSPEGEMAAADIVMGKSRVIVEAMACGRAAYVFDHTGGDGWLTPERYEVLESVNFGGQAEATGMTLGRLRADLAGYRPEMGIANRDLAVRNHNAHRHAEQLVCAFERLASPDQPRALPAREIDRLLRIQLRTLGLARDRAHEILALHRRLDAVEAENDDLRRRLGRSATELLPPPRRRRVGRLAARAAPAVDRLFAAATSRRGLRGRALLTVGRALDRLVRGQSR
jgi:hypothetical protein